MSSNTDDSSLIKNDSDARLFARKLNYSEEVYEAAKRYLGSLSDKNQLLGALNKVYEKSSNRGQEYLEKEPEINSSQDKQIIDNDNRSVLSASTSSLTTRSMRSLSTESCNSGKNYDFRYNQSSDKFKLQASIKKRRIYIDGSNVAMSHGKNKQFSWIGIKICVDWFLERQHLVRVVLKEDQCEEADMLVLDFLKQADMLLSTPSGCNDDYFLLEAAFHVNGIVVSNDMFRDECSSVPRFRQFVRNNRLPYLFSDDVFIPAHDPLGQQSQRLDEFLCDFSQMKVSSEHKYLRHSHKESSQKKHTIPQLRHSHNTTYQTMPKFASHDETTDKSTNVQEQNKSACSVNLRTQVKKKISILRIPHRDRTGY